MWPHILLSAVAFNVAFFFPDYLGFLIFFSPIPIVFLLSTLPGPWAGFKVGWWWGIYVFGMHFTWLLQLLLSHTKTGWLLCTALYLIVVGYFALSSACWLWLTFGLSSWTRYIFLPTGSVLPKSWQRLDVLNHITFIITTIAYWLSIENLIFIPPGLGTGYPFLNPCIPLARYSTFLRLLSFMSITGYCPIKIAYIAPVINRVKNTTAEWRTNPEAVGHKIYHQLCRNEQVPIKTLYVAPETTFPFPLNHYTQVTKLWSAAISDESHFFVGSILQEGQKMYQAVFWIQRGLIIDVYVKKLLTPFVEKTPTNYKNIKMFKNIFLAGDTEFCDDTLHFKTEFFDVTPRLRIIPRICLEFFFERSSDFEWYKDSSKNVMIFFFANDSWFNSFFRTTIRRLLIIKAHLIGLPVMYVGHFGCEKI